jgi:hypothetical protein
MRTTVVNPTLWLLAVTVLIALAGVVRRQSARDSLRRVIQWSTTTPVLVLMVTLALGGLGSRMVLGYLSPGVYAEEVVGARTFLAARQIYRGNDRAELTRWLTEEPPVIAPWVLPGITTCQASALEHRPQFFTSQGHLPTLLLASIPIVHFVGGRGLYLALVFGSLVSIIAMVGVLLNESGQEWRSRVGLLGLAAIAGWQPVLAGFRQGDAVLLAAALVALSWHFVRSGRLGQAGVAGGAAGCLVLPALGVLPALLRCGPRACLIGVSVLASAVAAAVAVGGPLILTDFVDALGVAARTYAEAMPNYAVIGRALVAGVGTRALLVLFALAALGSAMRGRSADKTFGTFIALALLAAPVVWSQHLALALVPLAVLLRRIWATGTSLALVAWAVLAGLLSLPDPAVAYLSEWLELPSVTAAVSPVVPVALLVLWASVLYGSEVTAVNQPESNRANAAPVFP